MKTIIQTSLLLIVLLIASCKNKGKEDFENKINEKKLEVFQFTLNIKVKDTTDVILYYKDGSNEWFVEEKAIWNNVKADEDFQIVVFNFEEGIIPNDFRLDIGRNEFRNQQPIEIEKITMNYFGNTFEIEQERINFFFKPNQYLIYNEQEKQYILQQDEIGNYDPFFETTTAIYPQITNLVLGNSTK